MVIAQFVGDAPACETDRARAQGFPEATGHNDAEREQYIAQWRDRVLAACRALAAKR
jgi:hypothetical protein